jgi:multiple sugar transport system permease protein
MKSNKVNINNEVGKKEKLSNYKKIFWSRKRIFSWNMVSPAFISLLLLAIGPLIFIFYNAFRRWNLTVPVPPKFIGFSNFITLFHDGRFWNAFGNTTLLMASGIIIQILLGLGIAMLLKGKFKGRNIITGLILIPVLIAPVVGGITWKFLFNNLYGLINYWLSFIGINGPLWISSTRFLGLSSILIVDAWQWTPFVALVLLAGLEGIPKEIYEAADVDGASTGRTFFKLTLPLLKPMFVLIILLRTIFIFKIYDAVIILTEGGPGVSTESLSLLTYYIGMKHYNIGYAMSMAVIQIIFMVIVANIFLKITTGKKKLETR